MLLCSQNRMLRPFQSRANLLRGAVYSVEQFGALAFISCSAVRQDGVETSCSDCVTGGELPESCTEPPVRD
ncbi:hypothetical protein OH76DRAFT_1413503 [Lentinus brumalis]|uniref:Uncharacterized protein n=1 Tax=Lentinus brumalis TaxID=2498619 RepID=A0A371CGX0_9APHY|nr:hypothetical protein OH76DRAFT_1413503 [Polyporus brumalis]